MTELPRNNAAIALEKARLQNKSWADRQASKRKRAKQVSISSWKRVTYKLPRQEARKMAGDFLKKYPKAAYWSEVESWRVLPDDVIEFTMRRLPTAD